jgi:hypothetical protein
MRALSDVDESQSGWQLSMASAKNKVCNGTDRFFKLEQRAFYHGLLPAVLRVYRILVTSAMQACMYLNRLSYKCFANLRMQLLALYTDVLMNDSILHSKVQKRTK